MLKHVCSIYSFLCLNKATFQALSVSDSSWLMWRDSLASIWNAHANLRTRHTNAVTASFNKGPHCCPVKALVQETTAMSFHFPQGWHSVVVHNELLLQAPPASLKPQEKIVHFFWKKESCKVVEKIRFIAVYSRLLVVKFHWLTLQAFFFLHVYVPVAVYWNDLDRAMKLPVCCVLCINKVNRLQQPDCTRDAYGA